MIRMKRAYEEAGPEDGERILVERLWPRGLTKEKARLDAWARDLAPSPELRKWYAHDVGRWPEFRERYLEELRAPGRQTELEDLAARARRGTVTFVYAASDPEHNSAMVLRDYLQERLNA